jgi:hypothetical protein
MYNSFFVFCIIFDLTDFSVHFSAHVIWGKSKISWKSNEDSVNQKLCKTLKHFFNNERSRLTLKTNNLHYNVYLHCNPVQGQYRARTGFSMWSFPHRENPVFITGNPCSHCRDPCFHYREWVCSALKKKILK